MNLPSILVLMACFLVIHHGTKPGHHLATLAAVMVICVLVGSNVSDPRR